MGDTTVTNGATRPRTVTPRAPGLTNAQVFDTSLGMALKYAPIPRSMQKWTGLGLSGLSTAAALNGTSIGTMLFGTGAASLAAPIAPTIVMSVAADGTIVTSSVAASASAASASGSAAAGAGGLGTTLTGAAAGVGHALMAAGTFLVTNPIGWAILAGIGVFLAWKFLFGKLKKAKKNFHKMHDMILQQLLQQGIPAADAEKIASQLAFEGISPKDRERLTKQAHKNPNGESAAILRQAGYDPATGLQTTNYVANYQKTGHVGDFTIAYTSNASAAEKALAAAEFAKVPLKADGSPDFAAYFDKELAKKPDGTLRTRDELQAEMTKRGFAIDLKSQFGDANITSDVFATYITSEVDQKNVFKNGVQQSDGVISPEEFADLFTQPHISNWYGVTNPKSDAYSVLNTFTTAHPEAILQAITELQKKNTDAYKQLLDRIKTKTGYGDLLKQLDKTADGNPISLAPRTDLNNLVQYGLAQNLKA